MIKKDSALILVDDDEPAIRDSMKTSLENHNHQAIIASDGIKAFLAKPYTANQLLQTINAVQNRN